VHPRAEAEDHLLRRLFSRAYFVARIQPMIHCFQLDGAQLFADVWRNFLEAEAQRLGPGQRLRSRFGTALVHKLDLPIFILIGRIL
jgi:hypothetical protein